MATGSIWKDFRLFELFYGVIGVSWRMGNCFFGKFSETKISKTKYCVISFKK